MSNDSVGAETVVPEGFQFPPARTTRRCFMSRIDEHYFDAMGLTLLRGRNFTVTDDANAPRVAIVNEQFAMRYWPGQDPIGKRMRLPNQSDAWVEVIGLAKTSKYIFIAEPPTEFVYFPYRQKTPKRMTMLARSAGDPGGLAAPLRETIHRLDAEHADLQRADDGRAVPDARDQRLQCADQYGRRARSDGAGARDRRTLRARRVRGDAADARDRHSHGDWRRPARRARGS